MYDFAFNYGDYLQRDKQETGDMSHLQGKADPRVWGKAWEGDPVTTRFWCLLDFEPRVSS